MRVLRVASDIYPDTPGGLGIHVHQMSKLQVLMGCDVTVVTSSTPSNRKEFEERDGYKIVRLKTPFRMMGNSFQVGLLTYILQNRSKFDVIHAHSHLFFSTNVAALLRKTGGPPLVITNHGVISTSAPLAFQELYFPRWVVRPSGQPMRSFATPRPIRKRSSSSGSAKTISG